MISAIHRGLKKLLDKLKQQLEQFRINPPSLTSLAARSLRLFVLVTLFWLAASHFQVPDNPYIRVIQKGVILCGVLLLGFYSIRWSISDQLTHNPPNLGYGLVILTVTVSLIGNAGDYALLHPQESLPLIAIAVITLLPETTALLCATDTLALGASKYLQEQRIDTLQLASVGNTPLMKFLHPEIVTVDPGYAEAGRQAACQLIAQVTGRSEPQQIIIPATLS